MKYALLLLLFVPQLVVAVPSIADLSHVDQDIQDFMQGEELIIVIGEHVPYTVDLVFDRMPNLLLETEDIPQYKETELTPAIVANKSLLLIGGPTQNALTKRVMEGDVDERSIVVGKLLFIRYNNTKYLVISDSTGFGNLPRQTKQSPLSDIVPEALVPLAATGVGTFFLLLWKLFGKLFLKAFRDILSYKILGKITKKEIKETFLGVQPFGIRIKLREFFAIFIGSAVVAIALSYMYYIPELNYIHFFGAAILANTVIYGLRHLVRLYLEKNYELHTEYKLWGSGIFFTLVTGWLGNPFCVAGYLVTKETKGLIHPGELAYKVNLVSQKGFFVFFLWNILQPNPITQMAMLLALFTVYVHLLPIAPFDGKKMFTWKPWAWWKLFIPYTLLYLVIMVL